MAKKFEITRGNAILNFSEEFCQSRCELVESESFSKVLEKFIKNQRRLETQLYIYLHERNADDFFLLGDLIEYSDTERMFTKPQDKRTEDYITGRFG